MTPPHNTQLQITLATCFRLSWCVHLGSNHTHILASPSFTQCYSPVPAQVTRVVAHQESSHGLASMFHITWAGPEQLCHSDNFIKTYKQLLQIKYLHTGNKICKIILFPYLRSWLSTTGWHWNLKCTFQAPYLLSCLFIGTMWPLPSPKRFKDLVSQGDILASKVLVW